MKIYPEYAKAFERGVELAFTELEAKKFKVKFVKNNYYFDNNPLAPRESLKKMIADQCTVILGFDNTNELLIVKDLAEKENQFIISMYADVKDIISQNIFSIQPNPDELVDKLRVYIDKKFAIHNVLIFNTIDRSDLVHYRQAFQTWFEEVHANITMIDLLERPFRLNETQPSVSKIIDSIDTVVLGARAVTSALIVDYVHALRKNNKSILFLATGNLGSSSVPVYFNAVQNKNIEVYFSRDAVIEDPDKKYQSFFNKYKSSFIDDPAVISGYAYDTTKYLGALLAKIPSIEESNTITSGQLLDAAKRASFTGITGTIFLPGPRIAHHKSFIVKVNSKGYSVVDDQ